MVELLSGALLTAALGTLAWLAHYAVTAPDFYQEVIEGLVARAGFVAWCVTAGIFAAGAWPSINLLPWAIGVAGTLSIVGLGLLLLSQRARDAKRHRGHDEKP